ncbi:phospholipid carrier-dependent glycosyltransferase [Qipengyuania psychrotolerans]|uniref:Polyprenol-phosphate-mannose--protein mannosyltransferase n=1 Tax=Qipengyuania psychrotolerans TaxID=2867238 RepID=A0ABX8ZG95_9SPHN|nr:phospholipid carrier-dependent glycosyltransferase [Qipengyuania psychrotolerans]QZD87924.1 phospholipid carrier-dependent glycosyltransferase [Qipengyuania psychrotolerans]
MIRTPEQPRDPLAWCAAFALAFWLLLVWNLAVPSAPYFDEVHYIPAARELLALERYSNREHPLFGKEMIALGIAIFGDNPWGWRIFPSLAGATALFAIMRAVWFGTLSRFAVIAAGILIATGFPLFVHSRIAMLDIFMVAALAVAFWQLAAAMREPEEGRWRLALTGIALGLAMASKWNAIPIAAVPGLGFLVLRWSAGRRRLFLSRRGSPVPGITLLEASVWLGIVPLVVYAVTFWPGYWFENYHISQGIAAHHRLMFELQTQVLKSHPYESTWPEWVLNLRAIWYLYENVDGAQRGVMLIGNPLTMLLGLPALLWCATRGVAQRAPVHTAVVILYAASLGLWLFAAKSTQFYYHYFLPSTFLLVALALTLDDVWKAGWRKMAAGTLVASTLIFAFYYKILAAEPLARPDSFAAWTWLEGWR